MKLFMTCWLMLLLVGCDRGKPVAPPQRLRYPALDESPPPPPPPLEVGAAPQQPPPAVEVPAVITGERWIDLKEDTDDMVKRLREHTQKAEPDDPFALKEEDIRKLSEQEGVRIY